MAPPRKALYVQRDTPDNHVDAELLESLSEFGQPVQRPLVQCLTGGAALVERLSSAACLFLVDAVLLRASPASAWVPWVLISASLLVLVLRFVVAARLRLPTGDVVALFVLVVSLVPILSSVGDAFAPDSLCRLSAWLTLTHLLTHAYVHGGGEGGPGTPRVLHHVDARQPGGGEVEEGVHARSATRSGVDREGGGEGGTRSESRATSGRRRRGVTPLDRRKGEMGERVVGNEEGAEGTRSPVSVAPSPVVEAGPAAIAGGIVSLNAAMFAAALLAARQHSSFHAFLVLTAALHLFVTLPHLRLQAGQGGTRAPPFLAAVVLYSALTCRLTWAVLGPPFAGGLAALSVCLGVLGPALYWASQSRKVWPVGDWDCVEHAVSGPSS